MCLVDTTLAKDKTFTWLIDETGKIEVRLRFRQVKKEQLSTYTSTDLEQLHAFVAAREWVDLANNVEKLRRGTEKQGLGWFLKEQLGKPVVDAQGASQLAALFVKAGAWLSNGKQRGMAFCSVCETWQGRLQDYYDHQVQAKVEADV